MVRKLGNDDAHGFRVRMDPAIGAIEAPFEFTLRQWDSHIRVAPLEYRAKRDFRGNGISESDAEAKLQFLNAHNHFADDGDGAVLSRTTGSALQHHGLKVKKPRSPFWGLRGSRGD